MRAKVCVTFLLFNYERNYDILKSKSSCFLVNKNINSNKNEMESKMENPTHTFTEINLYFSSCKNRELKVKLECVGFRETKNVTFKKI